MIIESYQQLGGIHPETAAITNVLANQGFVSPHNGRPFSEAMILGIAGGLGAGYILWEFKKYESAILVMGFQNRWNYTVEFMQNLCDRLGVTAEFKETGGQKTAAKHLEQALANDQAAIAWVDQKNMPYFYLRPMYDGCFGHFVTVFGHDEESNQVWLDDRAQKPIQIGADDLAAARGRIGSYKNRLLLLDSRSAKEVDVETAVRSGIEECLTHLGRDSKTFAIPVYQKWAKLMTDSKNKKGWPKVFRDKKGLYSTFRSLHEGIKLFGTAGGGLRGLYADFLTEAAPILNNDGLNEAAARYRTLATKWTTLADAALPDHIAPLQETRTLLAQKYDIFLAQGTQAEAELQQIGQELQDLEVELNSHLPLSDEDTNDLFATMQEHLFDIYEAEKEALSTLEKCMQS